MIAKHRTLLPIVTPVKVRSNILKHIFGLSHVQKLQFAKAEAQKEITTLKGKVAELERKLSAQQMPASKKKRF